MLSNISFLLKFIWWKFGKMKVQKLEILYKSYLLNAILSLLLLHILLCIFNKKLNMQMHDKSGKEEVYLRSSRPDLTRKIEIPNH